MRKSERYYIGTRVTLYGDLYTVSTHTLTNGADIHCAVRKPGETIGTEVDNTLIESTETGKYSTEIVVDVAGTWYYKWWNGVDPETVNESTFRVVNTTVPL